MKGRQKEKSNVGMKKDDFSQRKVILAGGKCFCPGAILLLLEQPGDSDKKSLGGPPGGGGVGRQIRRVRQ